MVGMATNNLSREHLALIGTETIYLLPPRDRNKSDTLMRVPVRIVDVRLNFGRVDIQVEPVGGSGTRWLKAPALEADIPPFNTP